MKLREPEMRRIASAAVGRLEKGGFLEVKNADRAAVEQRIVDALRANVRAEEEIEAEAERFAESHSREMVGMDRFKVVQLVKARIAKERGFTL
jgi:hypothetical protein